MKDLRHKLPQICFICHNHNPVLPSLMTYHRVCYKSNMTVATCGAGTANPSRAPLVFSGVRVVWSLVFCVVFCRSLFVFSGVRVIWSLVFCVVFCRSLFVFSGVRVIWSLVFCVVFYWSMFILLCCFVCHSLIYSFWWPLTSGIFNKLFLQS